MHTATSSMAEWLSSAREPDVQKFTPGHVESEASRPVA